MLQLFEADVVGGNYSLRKGSPTCSVSTAATCDPEGTGNIHVSPFVQVEPGSTFQLSNPKHEAMARKYPSTVQSWQDCQRAAPTVYLTVVLCQAPGWNQYCSHCLGKGPGYLADNSHYVEAKGLEDSLGNLDHNYTQTRTAHPTSAHH